jgi:protein gp37
MGEKTGIAWTDHTFNPWIGCQKVSEGCHNCYAERQNNGRFHWVGEWGKDYRRTSASYWQDPIVWAKRAVKDGVIRRVFCASLADVFDDNPQVEEWRLELWSLIQKTLDIGGLEWLILTKRPENIYPFMMSHWMANPTENIRLGVTAENQEMADERIPMLFGSWKGKTFVSIEPMIGSVSLMGWDGRYSRDYLPDWNWIICGAESGPSARPMDIEWARSVRDQCQAAGVPFFLKQMVMDGKLTVLPELDGKVWAEFPEA